MISQIKTDLRIMYGIDDFFYPVKEALHSVLLANEIPGNAIHYQVMFRDSFLT